MADKITCQQRHNNMAAIHGKDTKPEMVENPKVTIVELAKQLGISENAIQKQLKNLQEKGYLQRNGKTRGGSWQVLLVSTT